MTVEQAAQFFGKLELTPQQAAIAEKLLDEIRDRLRFLNEVGLEYLTLDRLSATLSGGSCGSFSGSWSQVTLVSGASIAGPEKR